MVEMSGHLDHYIEMGSEGFTDWVLVEESPEGRPAVLHKILEGDQLIIYKNGREMFNKQIIYDREIGKVLISPGRRAQVALGMRAHWIQAGWEPEGWAGLFVKNLKAKLIKLD